MRRLAILAAAASGWLVAALLFAEAWREYELGVRDGYRECEDEQAMRGGA